MWHGEQPARHDRADRDHHGNHEQYPHTPQHIAGDLVDIPLSIARGHRADIHRHKRYSDHRHQRLPLVRRTTRSRTVAAASSRVWGSGVESSPATASRGSQGMTTRRPAWSAARVKTPVCWTGFGHRFRGGPRTATTVGVPSSRASAPSRWRSPGTVAHVTTMTAAAWLSWAATHDGVLSTWPSSQSASRTVSLLFSAGIGDGTSRTLASVPPVRCSSTSPRLPCTHPEECAPSSAVLAAANPDVVAELHSTTRAAVLAAVANASANVVAP